MLSLGGRIYARSPVIDFARRGDRWVVRTARGELSARALVLASNAYTGEFSKALAPDLAHEVMPVLSWQMATQPLSDNVRKTIIPARQAMSDTHGELYFARYDARNRLVTGGAVIGPSNKAERLKARVASRLQLLWPLPFTNAVTIPAHALLRPFAPLMLLLYRYRDAREIA